MAMILDHVNYIYEQGTAMESYALKDIQLHIRDGEFIGIIGHTGSGKSTLVQLLTGLMEPSTGTVYYNGEDIHDRRQDSSRKRGNNSGKKIVRGKVGLVFQYPEHQLFETDVFRDVCFGPRNMGLDRKEAEIRAYTALKQVGMEDTYFYQSPFDLSGGQKRRAAIAGVLAMKPEVLILDEPAAGLDPKGRKDILDMIDRLHKETGITVILVSHSMEDVARYVDRLIVMEEGRVIYDDVPRRIFTRSRELEQMGLAAPQVTYVMQELRKRGWDVREDVLTVEEAREEISRVLRSRRQKHA